MNIICQRFAFLTALLATCFFILGCDGSWASVTGTPTIQSGQDSVEGSTQDASGEVSSSSTEGLPAALVSIDELKTLIDAGERDLIILEPSRSKEQFGKSHLPSAQFVDWVNDMTDPANRKTYMVPPTEQFENVMSRLGVKSDSSIIIYDRLCSRLSARLFWSLKYYGHKDVRILDGGFNAWAAKFDVVADWDKPEPSQYKVEKVNEAIFAGLDFVKSHLGDDNVKLIDGRPPKQFTGEEPGKVFHTEVAHDLKGHIPGALHVHWKDNFNEDGRFKSVAELKKLYQDCGAQPDNCVVTYCNEGLHAAPPWFVLTQMLGYQDVKLYDASMAEWANGTNPTETTVETSKE